MKIDVLLICSLLFLFGNMPKALSAAIEKDYYLETLKFTGPDGRDLISSISGRLFPFGVIVHFEKVQQEVSPSICSVTHLGNGVVVTAAECFQGVAEDNVLVMFTNSKKGDGERIFIRDYELSYKGTATAQGSVDMAILKIPLDIAEKLQASGGETAIKNKMPWGEPDYNTTDITQNFEHASVWGFSCDVKKKLCAFRSINCQATRFPITLLFDSGFNGVKQNPNTQFTEDDILYRKATIRLQDCQVAIPKEMAGSYVTGKTFSRRIGVFTKPYDTLDLLKSILEGNAGSILAGILKFGYVGYDGNRHLYPIPKDEQHADFLFGITAPFDNFNR